MKVAMTIELTPPDGLSEDDAIQAIANGSLSPMVEADMDGTYRVHEAQIVG